VAEEPLCLLVPSAKIIQKDAGHQSSSRSRSGQGTRLKPSYQRLGTWLSISLPKSISCTASCPTASIARCDVPELRSLGRDAETDPPHFHG
jgi:hypothetical protein